LQSLGSQPESEIPAKDPALSYPFAPDIEWIGWSPVKGSINRRDLAAPTSTLVMLKVHDLRMGPVKMGCNKGHLLV
jgi:hypothetical protein